jgi:hypothetical protein
MNDFMQMLMQMFAGQGDVAGRGYAGGNPGFNEMGPMGGQQSSLWPGGFGGGGQGNINEFFQRLLGSMNQRGGGQLPGMNYSGGQATFQPLQVGQGQSSGAPNFMPAHLQGTAYPGGSASFNENMGPAMIGGMPTPRGANAGANYSLGGGGAMAGATGSPRTGYRAY